MIDPYLLALQRYEHEIAPAREVIRRAQARLREAIASAPVLEADPAFTNGADPTEPDGAELAVEALIDHPEQGLLGPAVVPVATADPAAETQPEADVPPVAPSAGTTGAQAARGRPARAAAGEPASDPVASPSELPKELGTGGSPDSPGSRATGQGSRRGPPSSSLPGSPTPASPRERDGRDIDEECPLGCGRRFRWAPALGKHVLTCTGAPLEVAS